MDTIISLNGDAINDHITRLYGSSQPLQHIDQPQCVIHQITINKNNSAKIKLTHEALREFIADMAYQSEFTNGEYRTQCRRALTAALKHAVKNTIAIREPNDPFIARILFKIKKKNQS